LVVDIPQVKPCGGSLIYNVCMVILLLILVLVVGSLLVYISKFNFELVTVNLGTYVISDIPLFYVIVGSVLAGLVISYMVYLFHSLFISFKFMGKDSELKHKREEVLELTKRVHQLELENEKLKHTSKAEPTDPNAL
jgi:lipopolysaccharide assembly protein A